jgi:hypothetical protein
MPTRVTLKTYVHLMDGGLGGADFLDAQVGNGWATQHPQTAPIGATTVGADSAC